MISRGTNSQRINPARRRRYRQAAYLRALGSSFGLPLASIAATTISEKDAGIAPCFSFDFKADPPVVRGVKARPHHRQQASKAAGPAAGSRIAVTEPLPPFVAIRTSRILVIVRSYKP